MTNCSICNAPIAPERSQPHALGSLTTCSPECDAKEAGAIFAQIMAPGSPLLQQVREVHFDDKAVVLVSRLGMDQYNAVPLTPTSLDELASVLSLPPESTAQLNKRYDPAEIRIVYLHSQEVRIVQCFTSEELQLN